MLVITQKFSNRLCSLVLAGLFKILDKKHLVGFIVGALGLGLQINANHYQMTYYFLMLVGLITIINVFDDLFKKKIKDGLNKIGVVFATTLFSIFLNATAILATQEYSDFSTRGSSEISINPDGSEKEDLSGLSNEYITEYSYGKLESFNLIIPRFMGGGSSELIDKDSDFVKELKNFDNESANIIYQNALILGESTYSCCSSIYRNKCFLYFLISSFIDKRHLYCNTCYHFSLTLSGKNFQFLTDFMINYFPFYDKFRAVSSIQVIIEFIIPLIATMGLFKFFQTDVIDKEKMKRLLYTSSIFIFILVVMFLFGNQIFEFKSELEVFSNYPEILDLIVKERQPVFKSDMIRSIAIVCIIALLFWISTKKLIKKSYSLSLIGLVILFDLWNIDMNYVNEDNFSRPSAVKTPFTANGIDEEIMKDKSSQNL